MGQTLGGDGWFLILGKRDAATNRRCSLWRIGSNASKLLFCVPT
jgi:hypothetical protein